MQTTLYLHGFLSHPLSQKGLLLKELHEKLGKPFIAPELYMSPFEVRDFLTDLVGKVGAENIDVIGSSLGGYYAAWLGEHFPINRAVLLNPALGNWGKVDFHPGWAQVSGIDKKMYVCSSFMDELEAMLVRTITNPKKYMTLLSLKDEVLDIEVSGRILKETTIIRIPDGDHRISNFEPYLGRIRDFLLSGEENI